MSAAGKRVGFSGTEEGMTREQEFAFRRLMLMLKPIEFHHGMCVGADEEAHYVIKMLNGSGRLGLAETCKIVGHPGLTKDGRVWKRSSFCPGIDEEWEPKYFLDRNQDIVRVTDVLVATPAEAKEIQRSGTWATIREARRTSKPCYTILPDGNSFGTLAY